MEEEEEEEGEGGGGAGAQDNRGGVRYITEELLLKLTGSSSLSLVRSLNLSSSSGDKRFKFIENLHGCHSLQVLNLNHNLIQRMERLSVLTQLRELQLAHNSIQRIEGLELLSGLQQLNLSYNRIEHVPVWLGKKLHSLHTLHLQHNLITSLYEVSRLRSLSSLSELSVSGNPASSLPHSRLFLLYHLRTLDRLDDLPVTQEERGHAHQRFSAEELQRLQREVDSSQSELSRLQREQQVAVTRLYQQEETNRSLTARTQTQQHTHSLLEQELHTKNQLFFSRAFLSSSSSPSPTVVSSLLQLEKTMGELTRAFNRLYELEQELTFYKIDAKLSPLPAWSSSTQEVDAVDSLTESPYIGKARLIRNIAITSTPRNSASSSSSSSSSSPQTQEGSAVHPEVECVRPLLDDCITQQSSDDVDLLLTTNQHKQQLDAEHPRPPRQQEALCRLLSKLSGLEELRGEADETRRQMDRQSEETRTAEREMEELETQLLTLDTTDPQQAHVTSQLSSCRQLLGMMSRKQSELEGRLDDLLSRIARETQEIKELEQQLTDGQILANESLQKELEEVISGLQVYLRGLRLQAHRSQQQVHTLQAENQNLQLHLEDTQRHCRQLEDTARTHTQNMSVQQGELSVLQVEAQALRDRQVESSRQQAELEAELQQLREELSRQVTLGQLERGALQDAADKERQSREVRESELQSTIDSLQDDRFSLKQDVHRLQVQLDQSRAQHMETRTQLDQFTAVLSDLQSEAEELNGEFSPPSPEDMLSRSVEQLYRSIQETRTRTRTRRQNQDHTEWLEARLLQDSELQRLRDEMQTSESRNRLIQQNLEATLHQSRLQLQDVQQERDSLLQQLRSQSDDHHRSLGRLSTKLRQLGRSVSDADQLTAEQLKSTTDQLRALNQSVELLHAQKSVDEPDDDVQQDRHTHTVEELKVELTKAHRETHRLRQKLDRTRTRSRTRSRSPGIRDGDGGRWWFVPPGLSAPSLGSQGTQDSGLGLQYFSSPERGRQQDGPPAGGYWVYVPPTHTDSESGGSSSGGTPPPPPPPPPPPGIPDGLTPLVSPGWLLCGPAPAGGAALHCNIPEHRDPQGGRVCECEHRETERVKTKRLRHTLRQDRSVLQVCDEVQCVEKTLLRRRAELRRADRLLLEAQSCIHTCREQASAAQLEADVLQHRAQDSATCLQEATQHVREVEEEVQQLRRRKQQEEQTLREVEEERRSREEELQQLGTKIHSATDRLAAVLSDCEEAQTRLDSLSHQVEQQEQRLLQRREELRQEEQRLNSTVQDLLGQQEALLSQRRSTMSGVREEEAELVSVRAELSSHRADLRQVLQELLAEQQALEDVKNKRTRTLQQLHKKKDELDRTRDELDRTRDELDRTKDDLDRTKDELDRTMEELDRTKDALDRTKDELDRTKDDLDGTKDDLDRTKDELDRTKDDLDRTKDDLDGTKDDLDRTMEEVHQRRDELDGIQDRVERKREELAALQQQVESHRKEAESCDRDTKHLLSELQEVQEELSRRKEERSSLKEQCKHLEARRSHADRCLTAVEAELAKQREEHGRAQLLKQEAVREAAASQQQLHESSELLSLVGERVEQREQQLEELDTLILNKQTECGRLEDVQAAVTQLEDRGRRLTEQQLQLHLLREEVTERENQLLCKEEELKQHREELRAKEEGLHVKEEELHVKEEELQKKQDELCVKEEKLQEREGAELHRTKDDSEEAWSEEDGEGFYWSTAGPRSTSSSEEQRWEAELQREKLKQHEDRLKARLRCRLWNQEEVLEGRSLEAEESLHELKQRLDQLDSLLRP